MQCSKKGSLRVAYATAALTRQHAPTDPFIKSNNLTPFISPITMRIRGPEIQVVAATRSSPLRFNRERTASSPP
jgi:hypothetical protein